MRNTYSQNVIDATINRRALLLDSFSPLRQPGINCLVVAPSETTKTLTINKKRIRRIESKGKAHMQRVIDQIGIRERAVPQLA
jgi:hypothetical protein